MKNVIKLINRMIKQGVIKKYAIGGGMGTIFYTETFYTKDIDIFVYPQSTESGLFLFTDIYDFMRLEGWRMEGIFFDVNGENVHFVPVASLLVEEALEKAVIKKYEGMRVKVFSPEYLIAVAIETGRNRDFFKIETLINQAKIDYKLLEDIMERYNLKYAF